MVGELRVYLIGAGLYLLALGAHAERASAQLPSDPRIRESVSRGLQFLDKNTDGRMGGKCLIALAYLKAGITEHHTIDAAIDSIRKELNVTRQSPDSPLQEIYSTGLALVFLCSYDAAGYRREILDLLSSLENSQKPHGGWGYGNTDPGDTSMTQYAVLGLWEAAQRGIPINYRAVADVAKWLVRTQDPSGAWGYQGIDPGGYSRVPQTEVRHSLAAAGLGALYISNHLLRESKLVADVASDLPSVVKPVTADGVSRGRGSRRGIHVDYARIAGARSRGISWINSNYRIDPEEYTHYYLYALERYESIRAHVEHTSAVGGRWYGDGVQFLLKTQRADGSWSSKEIGAVPDTAFAILFLLRSMQKSIRSARNYGEGYLVGGRGLPNQPGGVVAVGGTVVPSRAYGAANDLLKALRNPQHAENYFVLENLEPYTSLALSQAGRQELEALEVLIDAKAPEARITAVRAIVSRRSLDGVPKLIYALSDPNWSVVREANSGLKYIAAKISGFELPEVANEPRRQEIIDQWGEWYDSARLSPSAASLPSSN